jgi:cobyric acid synthase
VSGIEKALYTAGTFTVEEASKRLNDLITIYKTGMTRMLCFYPGFDIKQSAFEKLDEEIFQKLVNNTMSRENMALREPYIMNEYRHGYFNRKEAMEDFRQIYQNVIAPLDSLFD